MEDEQIIKKAMDYIEKLFCTDSGGHDVGHTLRVYKNTLSIARNEEGCNMKIAALAALLHDADDHKLFNTENNANARKFLKDNNVPAGEIEWICEAINSVSFSQNKGRVPETLEGKIVQDADRLDALGAVGIARTFAFGGAHDRPFSDSLQHFHDKLLLLKDLMNTDSARKIAEKRHAYIEAFLKEYEEETEDAGF